MAVAGAVTAGACSSSLRSDTSSQTESAGAGSTAHAVVDDQEITLEPPVCEFGGPDGPGGVRSIFLVSSRGDDANGTWYLIHLSSAEGPFGRNEQVAVDIREGPDALGHLYEAYVLLEDSDPIIERNGEVFEVDLDVALLETASTRAGDVADIPPDLAVASDASAKDMVHLRFEAECSPNSDH